MAAVKHATLTQAAPALELNFASGQAPKCMELVVYGGTFGAGCVVKVARKLADTDEAGNTLSYQNVLTPDLLEDLEIDSANAGFIIDNLASCGKVKVFLDNPASDSSVTVGVAF